LKCKKHTEKHKVTVTTNSVSFLLTPPTEKHNFRHHEDQNPFIFFVSNYSLGVKENPKPAWELIAYIKTTGAYTQPA